MPFPDSRTVRGFLADGETGAGLGGLRVELWTANGRNPDLLAAARSDESGAFRVRVPPGPHDRSQAPDIEWRVVDRGHLLLSDARQLPPVDDDESIDLVVRSPFGEAADIAAGGVTFEIAGHVKGELPDRGQVQAVVKTLRRRTLDEAIVAHAPVDPDGRYRLTFEAPDRGGETDASVTVRLLSGDGEPIAESTPRLLRQRHLRIDVRAPRRGNGPSEFALVAERIAEGLDSGAEGLDGAEDEVIREVSDWLDVDAERLALYQEARALEAKTGVPAAAYYALGRTGTGPAPDRLVDASIAELRTTLEEAVAEGLVDRDTLGDLDPLVARIADQVVTQTAHSTDDAREPGLVDVLAAAGIPADTIAQILRRYQSRPGTTADFWDGFVESEAEAIAGPHAADVDRAIQLSGIVGIDPPLLQRLHDMRREGRWQNLDDLTDLSFDEWFDLVEQAEGVDGAEEGEGLEANEGSDEDEEEAWIEERVELIQEALEDAYPSRCIRTELRASETIGPAARVLLGRVPATYDFRNASIREAATADPALLEGIHPDEVEGALEEVAAVERVSRFTDRAVEVNILVGTGLRSALDVAAMPPRQFVHVYGEALGGRPQAARVHAQAQQAAAGVRLMALRLLQSMQRGPFVLGQPPKEIKDVANLQTLFQAAGGFCDCEHCGSVYSPAAYYVDLLRYLNVSSPERLEQLEARFKGKPTAATVFQRLRAFQPLDVLLGRRPDLADLPLSCENTLTPLPYIDLVNELLEARMTGGSAAFDTGKTPADVLRAVPQNLSREAYRQLQDAVHPLALPYHQPLSLARAYLGHLGVTRLELLRTMARGDRAAGETIAEALAMSPEEFRLIAQPPADLWRHLGFAGPETDGQPYLTALAHVPTFLDATGLTFQQLIDLVSTRFLNADNHLQLDTPTADCNPNIIRLTGLDETRLSRMVRLIRLQRRLGWAFGDLDRALTAFGATDLDAVVLEKLAIARDLAKQLDRPLVELLILWAPIDAWGKDNYFDKLFTTRAVAWRTQDERTFQLRPDLTELSQTGATLDPIAGALLAAFRITSEDLALIRALHTRRGAPPALDLAGLSALYRVVVLARALQLRIGAFDLLLRLTPPDADPFKPGDPQATRRFVEIVREVQASDFTPERLAYLFRHEAEPRRDPGPLPAQIDAVLATIRRGLADAFSETSRPAEVTGELLRQKLAVLFDPSLLDQAMDVLDPRTAVPEARRRDFFARHLARIFPDPAAAASRLFGEAPAPAPVSATPTAVTGSSVTPPATPSVDPPVPAATVPTIPATPTATPLTSAPSSTAAATTASDQPFPLEADAAPPAPPVSPLERRWRANLDFALDSLLPLLRTRQLRGAVIQTLSDTLGVTSPAAARLLEQVMRSRTRENQPLLADFLSLLGTGLTGAYFATPDLSGPAVVTRVDPELTFAWAGAPPAAGVPASRFSVRWSGRLLPRTNGPHTFYLQTDGGVRLSLKVGDTDRVLIDQPATSGRPVEHVSDPVVLDPAHLYEMRLEYRNAGEPARLALQVGTSPSAKQPLPTPQLYPEDGLSSFVPVTDSYRRLHKAALVLTGFNFTDTQLEWLTTSPAYLDLDALPMAAGTGADGVTLFRRWLQLAAIDALRRKLPRSNADLFDVFRASTLTQAVDRLVLATGWDRAVVDAFLGHDGLAIESVEALRPPADPAVEPAILKLARAVDVQRRVGVAPATLHGWANAVPDADSAATIVQAVKARYDETRWLEIARTLNDPLRAERRDALVAYLLPRMRDLGVLNRNQLFEFFLLDVDMNPCMLTSRIRQATGAIQTFFQRCLMNLELHVPPRVIDDKDWQWLKNYRVWEANRKVFLYPENWIEPELRDDKSPLFETLEQSILQQEIKRENVEGAFADYLEGLDEVSRLDVRGVWFEERQAHRMSRVIPSALRVPPPPSKWAHGTYHVFARTFNAPYIWYYRRLENGRTWMPWEKIDADIEGEHLVPVIYNRRMHLFWPMFREVNKKPPTRSTEDKGPPPTLGKDWEIQLAYTVYDRGKWSRKRLSTGSVIDDQTFLIVPGDAKGAQHEGSTKLLPSDYTLRAATNAGNPPSLRVHLYCRAVNRVRSLGLALEPSEVQRVATFTLNGCNGSLVPDHPRAISRATVVSQHHTQQVLFMKTTVSTAIGNVRANGGPSHSFRLHDGGILNAPPGYQVSAMAFAASRPDGSLLAFPPTDASGISVALQRAGDRMATSVVPVIDPKHPEFRGLYPFFFQDHLRSYFARPIYTDYRPPRLVAMPVFARRTFRPAYRPPVRRALPAARQVAPPPARKRRRRRIGPFRLRGEIDESLLAAESLDAWEDLQDEAWHPDDASEARRPQRRSVPRPAGRPAQPRRAGAPVRRSPRVVPRPRFVLRPRAGYHEQRLQFVAFEHPGTCAFMSTLKAKGIEGLLDFSTTRPAVGVDHVMQPSGVWALRRPTWFERTYGRGPLVHDKSVPHLDVAFEPDNPYSLYNWELFFHAPLQVAIRLAKDGRHEEAQRWFHFIFDPTTDSSAPSPKRYWRFAPFYENDEYASSRELIQLLSYNGAEPRTLERQESVRQQLAAWWEKPFSPHVIARLRTAAYQKAVVMKYIDNLVEWGDKLFRRDSMESIQEATQIYILAANILGPRPEKIPPIVSKPTLTFQKMRHGLNLFSNYEVQLEHLQVRRPFRISARPDFSGASSVLGMATQYFCTPPNPQMDKYWDTVADRLFKIRNCMNIQGIVRQLPLFEPPIDPGLLVRAAAAGVDLGSVIASLNAPPPHYRFRFLLARAVRLAEEIRSFGKMTLEILERRDAEALAALRASNEVLLLDAIRDIRKKQTRQVEEALNELSLRREGIDLQIQHLNSQLQQLMNPQEEAQQKSLSAAQVITGVSEGVDLVSKVMHAIPEFQTGGAGAFSSPFVTLQLGGQMLGDIAGAFSASLEKVMARNETEADLAAKQAEYQRRREEWQHEMEVLTKEKAQVDKRILETQLKLEIATAEMRRHDIDVDNSRKVQTYLRDKYTNQQLYGWMLGQVSGVYFQAYKVAFDAAQQAERAFRFERGDSSSSFVEFSYWDSLKKGLFAGERLLVDLRRMESAHVEGDRRLLEVTRHVSLHDDFPLALMELIATGRCQIEVSEALLDGDFPGHYFRRLKTVSVTISGVPRPHRNVNCTLTLLENRLRTDANASGSYARAADGEDARFLVNPAPLQAVATSQPDADAGVFHLRFDDDRYLPFEGAGAISTWRIELPQADNAVDLSSMGDVVLSLSYSARGAGGALEASARADREKKLARGGLTPEPQHAFSLKRDLPAVWKALTDAAAGKEVEVTLPLGPDRFPGRYRGLDVRVERVTVFAQPRATIAPDAIKLRLDPPKGSGTPLAGWTPPWPRVPTVRAVAEVSGPPGNWKLAVSTPNTKIGDLLDDVVLVFEVRARKN